MYIMLDHNQKTYRWFLKILYSFRLYFVCYCCCKKMITRQLNNIRLMESTIVDDDKRDNYPKIENTNYETKVHDISVNHAKIEIRRQFSVETTNN